MCDSKKLKDEDNIKLLLYRLDKLEEEQRKDNQAIMTTLQAIQDGLTETNKTMVVHTTKIAMLEGKVSELETDNEKQIERLATHRELINSLRDRLNIYKAGAMFIIPALAVYIAWEVIKGL